jgi:acetyl-CoA carboxylase alpha subunit
VQTDEYKTYRTEQEKKIFENDKIIANLKTKKNQVKKEKLTNYETKINELEKRNNELRKKIIVNYKDQGVNKWESFKKEFNHDMDELGLSLKNLFKDNVKE